MLQRLFGTAILGMAAIALSSTAQAYPVLFATGNTAITSTTGRQFNAAIDNTFQTATGNVYVGATFTYTGPLNFRIGPPQNTNSTGDLNSVFFANGTISGYTPFQSGTTNYTLGAPSNANSSTLVTFLASSGSAANFQYGSIMAIDLGSQVAGTVLTIDHDDGASVYQNGVRVGNTTAGPTPEVVETVRLTGTGDVQIVYARENGAPSVLAVGVPEPMSLGLLGAALAGLGFVRRNKRAA